MAARPRIRLYLLICGIIVCTIMLSFLDYKFTLIPRLVYKAGDVEEENYIHKFNDIFQSSERATKQILLWTGYFDPVQRWTNEINANLENCEYKCTATNNRANLPLSDAVMFHDADIKSHDMPGLRIKRQPWILFTMEPSALVKKNYKWLNRVFNWTISYRNYSTIINAYGQYVRKTSNKKTPLVSLQNKNRTMFTVISNCHDSGKRFKLIQDIMKYVDVDTYGRCGKQKCAAEDGPCQPREIMDLYKYRLAFENSHCRHYVTEKYWSTLQSDSDIIPIVNWVKGQRGPTVVPDSYINFYDFDSMESFVSYVHNVSTNENLFQHYFKWRENYTVTGTDVYCRLCEKLHQPYKAQTYTDLMGWFTEDTCTKYSLIGMAGRWLDRRFFDVFNR